MQDVVNSLINGFPDGCIYALVATGLVLGYRASGVFNFAFGAQAFTSATVYYVLVIDHGWPRVPAAFVAIVGVGIALGFLLDRFIFRLLRTAPPLPKLVAGIGLLVGIPEVVRVLFGTEVKNQPPSIAPDPDKVFHFGDYNINADIMMTVVTTLVVIGVLTFVLLKTPLGLRMRAVVESPRMAQLNGINADRVASGAWMLSSVLAGLAGVLLAPLNSQVDSNAFTLLLVAATAAAVFGGLSSLPLTLAGGVLLGVSKDLIVRVGHISGEPARYIRPSVPFIFLALSLLLLPAMRGRRDVTDPLSGVDPPPPALAVTYMDPRLAKVNKLLFALFIGVVFTLVQFSLSGHFVQEATKGLALTVIFLSVTVLTGLGGQISLCQASFAGLGAFTAGQLAAHWGVPIFVGMLAGGAVAAVLGGLIAIPCLRLGGLSLALGTLAFALMIENTLFQTAWLTGAPEGVEVPRPVFLGIDFGQDRPFFFFTFAVFALCGLIVVRIRRGTTGQVLAALRGSEVAAAAIGINPVRAKVTAFTVSAAIAGVGGALFAAAQNAPVTDKDFPAIYGLVWVLLVCSLGSRTVDGAVNAGLSFILLPLILEDVVHLDSALVLPLQFALFGFGAISFAKHQEGIVEFQKRMSIEKFNARIVRWRGPAAASP
jgi:ABC-type branched-subunit amino acid transport system permease subunit